MASMTYLDIDCMNAIEGDAFQHTKPFPFVNPKGLLTEDGYTRLLASLPDLNVCEASFGRRRWFGQRSHDRFNLEYRRSLDLSKPWGDFIDELTGDEYRRFLERMFGRRSFRLRFHWHYAPSGGSVSPHCDSNQKLGSHVFYLNSSHDWKPEWGGATLVLDDGGRMRRQSNPAFEDFDRTIPAEFLDNRSFLFRRTDHSWHGVREVHCPEGAMRRVFIVVIDGWRPHEQIRSRCLRPGVERF
jgi:hypothetical protein